jgi:hypothetical protein
MTKVFPRSVWLYALLLAFITALPYISGSLSTPERWQYSGAPAVPVGVQVDYNSHLAKMWQGSRGQWDYHLLFTHEEHRGIFPVQGFYVALGALASVTPFSLPAVYHIARFALTICMVLAIWAFASRFFDKPSERWLALLFGTIVGGWSWLLLIFDPAMTANMSPIEFWLTDAFNVFGALYMPHFAAAVTLQIVVMLSYDRWVRAPENESDRPRISPLIILTVALAAESIIQPYVVLLFGPLLVILTAYHVFSAKRLSIKRALWLIIPLSVHGGLILYQYAIISGDPIWAAFTAQNQTLSPLVTYYLLGYLPFLIPIIPGARVFMLDDADDRWWMPILWVALVAMLLYAPFPTQRRYLLGVQTPLAILAAYGWSRAILPRLKRPRRPLLTIIFMALTSIALVSMIFANVAAISNPSANAEVYYQPDELQGYAWLTRESPDPNDLILTTFDLSGQGSGGRLVGATGRRVFIGHWYETADFTKKIEQVKQFYNPSTADTWRRDFLADIDAVYVWYDDYARAVGDWNPENADYLESVFTSGTVAIYKVLLPSES